MITQRHLDDEGAQAYLEELLPGPEAEAAEAHLRQCPECSARVASYRSLSQALGALDRPATPADFAAGVAERIDSVARAQLSSRRLAIGILTAATLMVFGLMAGGGKPAWSAAFFEATGLVEAGLELVRIGAAVLPPLVQALEVEILLACGLAFLSLFAIFSVLQHRSRELAPPRGLS